MLGTAKNQEIYNGSNKVIYGLHYYDSVLVIEKGVIEEPFDSKTGHKQVLGHKVPVKEKIARRLNIWLRIILNIFHFLFLMFNCVRIPYVTLDV